MGVGKAIRGIIADRSDVSEMVVEALEFEKETP